MGLETGLAKAIRGDDMPNEASRLLEEQLGALGVQLRPLFPGIEPSAESMISQFTGSLPSDVVDERLVEVRELPGVDYAYKKPTALPAPDESGTV